MVRVVTAGHVNWDVTLRVDRLPEPDGEARIDAQHSSGGGSAANVAAALAGFDVPVGLVGSVGDDEYGLLARRELERAGVDLAGLLSVPDRQTTVKYLVVADGGEVMVLGNDGANEAVRPADVESEYVRAAEHLHLTSQHPETAAHLVAIAREAGLTVSFDPGRRLCDRDYGEALARADVVFLNDREARSSLGDLGGLGGPDGDLGDPDSDRVVVIKHGGDGAAVLAPDGTFRHPGFPVEPVDTTGAGDAFAAGFLAVQLDGGGYEVALEYANACGALTARQDGARAAPTRAEVEAFLDGQG